MNHKNSHKQSALALALLCCAPAVLMGCATQQTTQLPSPGATQAAATAAAAAAAGPARNVAVDEAKPASAVVASPPPPRGEPTAQAAEAKKAAADEGIKVIPGTGVFVKPAAVTPPTTGPQDIVLNFEGADLREVVRVVMGEGMLNENYTIDPKVNGTVTIHTSQPINRAGVMPILDTVLRMNGAAMVKENGAYKIAPIAGALRGSSTPQLGAVQPGYGVQVVPLQYIAAREMAKILEPLMAEGSILRVDESRNLLMLAGGEAEMRHALETVSVFDLDWLTGMSVGLFTLKSVDVKSIMPELELLLGDKAKSPFAGLLRIVPMERMNAVFVVSPRPQYLEQARTWVERLDRNGGKSGTRLYVYQVQNGNAEKIAALLSQVMGGKSTSGTPAATVAPGLTGTSLQTGAASTTGGPGGSTSTGTSTGASLPGTTVNNAPGTVATGSGEALGLSAASQLKIIADRDNNSLVILANGAEYEKIEEAIKKLDVIPRQVLVEVTIAEVQLTGSLSYGLEWFFSGNNNLSGALVNNYGTSTTPFSALPVNANVGTFNPSGDVNALKPAFSAIWKTTGGNISAVLTALANNTKVNVLSSPHIMVIDNQVAKINVGQSVSVQNSQTSVGTNLVNSFSYVDTGVVLSVRPHINSGGLVTLEVSQEVSDVVPSSSSSNGASPTINKRTAQTMVAVQSGDTMVLAGLIKDNKSGGSAGIPLLSEIPVVGALFGQKSASNDRSELIITITPRVVNDYQQAREVTAEFRKKLTGLNKLNAEAATAIKSDANTSTTTEGAKGN